MSLFDDEFIHNLPEDYSAAGYLICAEVLKRDVSIDELLQACGLLQAISEEHELNWNIENFAPDGNSLAVLRTGNDVQQRVTERIERLKRNLRDRYDIYTQNELMGKYKSKYRLFKKGAFVYEFSDSDLDRVQILLNELREKISSSNLFDELHKRRLMSRLEKLQRELHKKQSDLDHFWGLVGDAGVAVGKFGKDAKPFVDRIKEITNIVWKTQSKAEQLPNDAPQPLLNDEEKT